ncbi:MAG: winged helix-turn-helix domain-containing protein [Acetobacteraceae bacterium]
MDALQVDGAEKVYCFENFRLIPGRQSLLHGGRSIRVGSRALELLRLLVERPGELMGKASLIRQAWPDTFVHKDNLKVNIAALRRALREVGGEGPYIATVPGRGYRFVAPVRVESVMHGTSGVSQVLGNALPEPTTVIGRDGEVATIAGHLAARRFVTVVGTAGVGKTTVAVAAARRTAAAYPDGVCFVDLAAIGDPQLVPAAIAAAVGSGGNLNDLPAGILEALRGRRCLLILDNCEHVLQAAALIAGHIHAGVAGLAILATSREPLRTRVETVLRLAPLPCPESVDGLCSEQALAFASVALFVARAGEAAGYRISDADAPVVAAICRRVDGLPLAIELAAARLRGYAAATLLDLLEHGLEPLSCGPSHAPIRQQALMSTLDWSYRLLSADEAAALRLVSVFAGRFTLKDSVDIGAALGRTPAELSASLESLAAKSLLSFGYSDAGLQYRLLETTRAYAAERLCGAGEHRRAAAAHARFLLARFECAEAEWQWRVREEWTSIYGRHLNDLRKAIDWAFGGGRRSAAGRPAHCRGDSAVGRDVLGGRKPAARAACVQSEALAGCDASLRMKLMTAHAWGLAFAERLEGAAETSWLENLRLAEQIDDVEYRLRALWGLASLRSFTGRHRLALGDIARFERLAEQVHDHSAIAAGERLRLITGFYCGDMQGAREKLERLARRHDRPARRSRISRFQMDHYVGIRVSLAAVSWVCGRPEEAMATAQAALDGAIEIEHVVSQANALAQAIIPLALWTGQVGVAEHHLAMLVANLNRRDLAIWGPLSRFFAGVIRGERGLGQMSDALDELVACNVMIRMPMFRSMLAEAALQHGDLDIARANVPLALDLAEREEPWCLPEVLRVQGLLRWQAGDVMEAERSLLRAVAVAVDAGSLGLELRARQSLARVTQRDG